MEFRSLRHPEYNLVTLQLRHSSTFTDNTCELSHPRKTNNSGRVKRAHLHLVQHPKKIFCVLNKRYAALNPKLFSIKAKGKSKTKQVKRGKSNPKHGRLKLVAHNLQLMV